ncbi:MAG: hypothetical protein AAF220_13230 [Pseudomonadota bacterium]
MAAEIIPLEPFIRKPQKAAYDQMMEEAVGFLTSTPRASSIDCAPLELTELVPALLAKSIEIDRLALNSRRLCLSATYAHQDALADELEILADETENLAGKIRKTAVSLSSLL